MTDNNEEDFKESEYDENTKALFAIWEECPWPSANAIRDVRDCIGKTVKFSQSNNANPDQIIIVFTDNSFLLLTADYPHFRSSVEMNIPSSKDKQDLICDAGLVSQETLAKYNKFFKDRELVREKERDLEQFKILLEKYPEFK